MKKLMRRTLLTIFPIAIFLLSGSSSLSGERRPMTVVDLINIPSLSDPRLSPDGTQILFVLSKADWKRNRRISHIWRVNADGSGLIQMTNRTDGANSPRWSSDGNHIAFISRGKPAELDEKEKSQICLIRNAGGESFVLTNLETGASNIQWSPDGEAIYYLARDPDSRDEKERKEAKDDVVKFDEDFKQIHLWRLTVANRVTTRITEGDYSIRDYRLSNDGTMIAHHRSPTPLYDDADESEVWVMDADGSGARQLTQNSVLEVGAQLSPDNTTVLFLSDSNEQFETYYNDKIFLVPAVGGQHRVLLSDQTFAVTSATWSHDGEQVHFLANSGVRSQLFSVDPKSEELLQVTNGDHSLRGYDYLPDQDLHVVSVDGPANAGDLYLFKGSDWERATQVTEVFDYLSEQFLIPRQESIQWKGEDGESIEGLVYYPIGYEEGTAYPLCVQTHGGPASSDRFRFGGWRDYIQVLAARGWVVFRPNYRGSTGYGDKFLRDMVGHYFHQAHLDVMAGVDYLVEAGIADAGRMVKMGWSAGGHMTNKIITHTDRFKAASSGAGAVNWISMYGQSDVRIYRTPWFGGTPWQKDAPIDLYWDSSPLKEIARVRTPTLVLVGENDVRVPASQSVELYRALKTNGVPTHLYIAPREPHGWRELRHQLFKVNVELEWFEKHALGREYVWEKAPGEGVESGLSEN